MIYSLNWALRCAWKFLSVYLFSSQESHFSLFSIFSNSSPRSNDLFPHSYPIALPPTFQRKEKFIVGKSPNFSLPSNLVQSIPILSVTVEKWSVILPKWNLPILWILALLAYSGSNFHQSFLCISSISSHFNF